MVEFKPLKSKGGEKKRGCLDCKIKILNEIFRNQEVLKGEKVFDFRNSNVIFNGCFCRLCNGDRR